MKTNTENTEPAMTSWPCHYKGCQRIFDSPQALNMHVARVHTMRIRVPLEGKSQSRSLERRRIYQRRLRERYKLQGRDSRGYPIKETKEKASTKWTPERRAKFQRTMRKLARQRNFQKRETKKRLHYVYPLPKDVTPEVTTEVKLPWIHAQLHHCPACGEDLTAWKKE